ncbi:MAG: glycosyltransferase [Caldilinea sp. CFX5]|nr:glycosyltransferase [Caldilinea sp. CFX5]
MRPNDHATKRLRDYPTIILKVGVYVLRVAVVTPYLPWPADTGGKLRSYYLIRGLAQQAETDLYTVCYGAPPDAQALAAFCRRVEITVLQPPSVRWPVLRALTQSLPRSVTYFRTAESMATMRQKLAGNYDLLVADEIAMAPYLLDLPGQAATPKIVMRQKIDYLHYAEVAAHRPWNQDKVLDWLEAERLQRFEYTTMPRFDGAVVCSQEDERVAAQQGPTLPIDIIVNGADTDYFTPMRRPDPDPTLLLIGTMHYYPNIDAALYFFETMFPALHQAIPNLKVLIVGHLPPPEIQALGTLPGVTVTGSVPDVRPYLARSWALAVPLRLGGGTRLKIVEAMASGLPVVTTTVGAQGLAATDGQQLLVADTPEAFVQKTVRLLQDPQLREQIAAQGAQLVQNAYSWQGQGRRFADFCVKIAAAKASDNNPLTVTPAVAFSQPSASTKR